MNVCNVLKNPFRKNVLKIDFTPQPMFLYYVLQPEAYCAI
jgi:hypothetical protein